MVKNNHPGKWWLWPGVVVLASVLGFAALLVARSQAYMVDGDFFKLWLAGRMVWTGEDPYSPVQWAQAHRAFGSSWLSEGVYLYPLPLASFFAPLGLLPFQIASVVWVYVSLVMIIAAVVFIYLGWETPGRRHLIIPALAGVILSRPVLVTLRNGQLGAFLLLLLAGMIFLWEAEQWIAGGLLLPLLALKPSIGLPLGALIGLWLLWHRRWRALAGAAGSLIVLLGLGYMMDSAWIVRYLEVGTFKLSTAFGQSPTVWGFAATVLCDFRMPCTPVSGSLLTTVLILSAILVLSRPAVAASPVRALGALTAVALLLPPYLWAYDQILLMIPVLSLVDWLYRRGSPYLLAATLPLAFSSLTLVTLYLATLLGHDVGSAFLPLLVFCLVAAIGWGTPVARAAPHQPAAL